MRIVLFPNTDFFAWVLLQDRIRLLRDMGHDVVVMTKLGRFRPQLETLGVELVDVPIARTINPVTDARALIQVSRHLLRLRPDVLNAYTSKTGFLGRVAGRVAGVPLVVHTLQGLPFYEGQPRALYGLYVFLEWIAGRFGHALFSENREDLDLARRYRLAPEQRMHHIGSGVMISRLDDALRSCDRQRARDKLGIPAGTPVIFFPARLEPVKGHAFFFRVLARLREISPAPFVCLCAGQGYLRAELEEQVRTLDLVDRVTFLGFHDDVPELLAASDVMVLPSEKEGIPRSIMEAMAARLPVVAADVRGTREVVVSGETGYLSRWGDADTMAGHLARLLEDPNQRIRLGEAGRRRAEAIFDDRGVVRRMDALYRELSEAAV
jgi:glycosyltransferase involved in cell wall biosynthesis